jgi:putative ABC transport system substrate-binding protein
LSVQRERNHSSSFQGPRLPALAAELAALKPDVIVTNGEAAIRAVKTAAGATPIVMAIVDDPVEAGFAQSLAHPGGNLTGLSNQLADLLGKRLQLLHEMAPKPGCVAVLGSANIEGGPRGRYVSDELAPAARALKVTLLPIPFTGIGRLAAAFADMARQHCRAVLVIGDPRYVYARRQLVALAARYRIAAGYDNRLIVEAGGLMSYGPDTVDMFRQAARYVDKILKGAKPGDLPIERPTKLGLEINLKTARALGLTVPPLLLAQADEVIQ